MRPDDTIHGVIAYLQSSCDRMAKVADLLRGHGRTVMADDLADRIYLGRVHIGELRELVAKPLDPEYTGEDTPVEINSEHQN